MSSFKNQKNKSIKNIQTPIEETSDNEDDIRKYIKSCVENELHSIMKSRLGKTDERKVKISTPIKESKQSGLITCECGKQVKSYQLPIHLNSKYHKENK